MSGTIVPNARNPVLNNKDSKTGKEWAHFQIPDHPLFKENGSVLKPTADWLNSYMEKAFTARVQDLRKQGRFDDALTLVNRKAEIEASRLISKNGEEQATRDFIREFIRWIKGTSKQYNDKKYTWWGNEPLAGKEIKKFIYDLEDKRTDYKLAVQKILAGGVIPNTLMDAWIYFKYIVTNSTYNTQTKEIDIITDDYLDDFDMYLTMVQERNKPLPEPMNTNPPWWGNLGPTMSLNLLSEQDVEVLLEDGTLGGQIKLDIQKRDRLNEILDLEVELMEAEFFDKYVEGVSDKSGVAAMIEEKKKMMDNKNDLLKKKLFEEKEGGYFAKPLREVDTKVAETKRKLFNLKYKGLSDELVSRYGQKYVDELGESTMDLMMSEVDKNYRDMNKMVDRLSALKIFNNLPRQKVLASLTSETERQSMKDNLDIIKKLETLSKEYGSDNTKILAFKEGTSFITLKQGETLNNKLVDLLEDTKAKILDSQKKEFMDLEDKIKKLDPDNLMVKKPILEEFEKLKEQKILAGADIKKIKEINKKISKTIETYDNFAQSKLKKKSEEIQKLYDGQHKESVYNKMFNDLLAQFSYLEEGDIDKLTKTLKDEEVFWKAIDTNEKRVLASFKGINNEVEKSRYIERLTKELKTIPKLFNEIDKITNDESQGLLKDRQEVKQEMIKQRDELIKNNSLIFSSWTEKLKNSFDLEKKRMKENIDENRNLLKDYQKVYGYELNEEDPNVETIEQKNIDKLNKEINLYRDLGFNNINTIKQRDEAQQLLNDVIGNPQDKDNVLFKDLMEKSGVEKNDLIKTLNGLAVAGREKLLRYIKEQDNVILATIISEEIEHYYKETRDDDMMKEFFIQFKNLEDELKQKSNILTLKESESMNNKLNKIKGDLSQFRSEVAKYKDVLRTYNELKGDITQDYLLEEDFFDEEIKPNNIDKKTKDIKNKMKSWEKKAIEFANKLNETVVEDSGLRDKLFGDVLNDMGSFSGDIKNFKKLESYYKNKDLKDTLKMFSEMKEKSKYLSEDTQTELDVSSYNSYSEYKTKQKKFFEDYKLRQFKEWENEKLFDESDILSHVRDIKQKLRDLNQEELKSIKALEEREVSDKEMINVAKLKKELKSMVELNINAPYFIQEFIRNSDYLSYNTSKELELQKDYLRKALDLGKQYTSLLSRDFEKYNIPFKELAKFGAGMLFNKEFNKQLNEQNMDEESLIKDDKMIEMQTYVQEQIDKKSNEELIELAEKELMILNNKEKQNYDDALKSIQVDYDKNKNLIANITELSDRLVAAEKVLKQTKENFKKFKENNYNGYEHVNDIRKRLDEVRKQQEKEFEKEERLIEKKKKEEEKQKLRMYLRQVKEKEKKELQQEKETKKLIKEYEKSVSNFEDEYINKRKKINLDLLEGYTSLKNLEKEGSINWGVYDGPIKSLIEEKLLLEKKYKEFKQKKFPTEIKDPEKFVTVKSDFEEFIDSLPKIRKQELDILRMDTRYIKLFPLVELKTKNKKKARVPTEEEIEQRKKTLPTGTIIQKTNKRVHGELEVEKQSRKFTIRKEKESETVVKNKRFKFF